jgi:hypothetical protein
VHNSTTTLNLRGIRFDLGSDLGYQVEGILDAFITPYLLKNKNQKLRLIVGKGLNSKQYIAGKNPLRYYTENYLDKLNLNYQNGGYEDGQEGVILVWV